MNANPNILTLPITYELSKSNNGCFKIVPLDTLGGVVPINGSDLMYFSILNIHSYTNPDDHDKVKSIYDKGS